MELDPEEVKRREEVRRRNEARIIRARPLTTEEEWKQAKARLEEDRRLDDATTMVVEDALYAVYQGAKRGRSLLNVVAQLITHLTPEQQLGLAELLPGLLSAEALAKLGVPPAGAAPRASAG